MTAPSKVRRTQASRSAATRERLLDATTTSLYERGYAATSTTIVADMAGVSRGAMLHQFASKADLMTFVVQSIYEEELPLYAEMLRQIDDRRERLLSMPEIIWKVLSRPRGIAVLEIMQGARSDLELAAKLRPIQIAIERDSFGGLENVATRAGVTISTALKRLIVWSVRGLSVAGLLTEDSSEMIESVRLLRRMIEIEIDSAAAPGVPQ